MNKVIKGKRYDTDTAERLLASKIICNGYKETLLKKRTGEFFLLMENMVIPYDGRSKAPDKIKPISLEDAQEWVERVTDNDGDTYERIFGEIGEDGEKVRMCISVMAKTEDTLKKLAVERKISVSEMIDKLVADWERKNKN